MHCFLLPVAASVALCSYSFVPGSAALFFKAIDRGRIVTVGVQALDLQQLFLAMTGDFRIIVVKLADRLHNMRTMASMPAHKQSKIALETLRVFAPLANMLGLWRVKIELEDLSLQCAPRPSLAQQTFISELYGESCECLVLLGLLSKM